MGQFSDLFVAKPPRELAGSRTAAAYDYQKDWALCKLLMLHQTENDYLLVLDYHEDVVVFDSADDPARADFYQLKQSKSSNWTVNRLTKPKNPDDSTSSILGKLFTNERQFPEHARYLVFVSNRGLNCTLLNEAKALECENVHFQELKVKDKEIIRNALHEKGEKITNVAGLAKLSVQRTPLGVENHRALTIAQLVDFFDRKYPDKPIATALGYRTLFDEIRRKTNCSKLCQSHDELIKLKAIGKREFSSMLARIVAHASSEETWNEIDSRLSGEAYSFSERQKLRGEWQRYIVARMDVNDELSIMLKQSILTEIVGIYSTGKEFSLRDLVNYVFAALSSIGPPGQFSKTYIEAAIICEVIQYDPISETSSELEEETA